MRSTTISTLTVAALALALTTVFAVPAAAHVAPWQTRGTYWAPAPADVEHHGFAQRLQTVEQDDPRWGPVMAHHGSISFSPDQGLQLADLAALSVDVLLEQGACDTGSPRFNLRVDADGDGSFDPFKAASDDFYARAYPAAVESDAGCPTGAWVKLDPLREAGASWEGGVLGGVDYQSAADKLASEHPDHTIPRIDLQFDNTKHEGPATIWFDDIAIHNHTLSEPTDGELICPATVEDPLFGGFGACPFRITDGGTI